ncbi:hypothetical protein N7447_004097 [Penicillium robsamsonii]|uniref:uncharacterized protein n=1 Tax=Penicillium robsamsonii TaxID=1792511 RepID=UPI002548C837|nr:uncharacterized protein N7447_004097 [Penicillium robsamsonii]KAJ5827334.1 hypothetical protein N7447_004097 [Penicillium robsamsonii]
MEDLDLDKSYGGILVPPKLPARPKKSRPWVKWNGTKPITDPAQLPRGWHMNEDDLHPGDIDGQIERCLERIAENITPQIFQQRLEEFMASKTELEAMTFPGSEELSWEIIRRVHELEGMKTDIAKTADEYEQLLNVDALLTAYKSEELEWHAGLVTYWSRGVQICQPTRFDWDEFEAINLHLHGGKGLWMEGVKLAVRLPGMMWFAELDFVHDNPLPRLLDQQYRSSRIASGAYITRQAIEVEVTILEGNRQKITAWTRTRCCLNPGSWTLSMVPRLHISNTRSELNLRDLNLASSPPVHNPQYRSPLPVPNIRPRVWWVGSTASRTLGDAERSTWSSSLRDQKTYHSSLGLALVLD